MVIYAASGRVPYRQPNKVPQIYAPMQRVAVWF